MALKGEKNHSLLDIADDDELSTTEREREKTEKTTIYGERGKEREFHRQ